MAQPQCDAVSGLAEWHRRVSEDGALTSGRITERELNAQCTRFLRNSADTAIIDITGVPMVDTLTAQHLLKAVSAAPLMGADRIEYPCPDGILVVHSDGVTTGWTLGRYPGLVNSHPLLVAGVLYRDFARRRDDVAIVAVRTRFSS